MRRRTENKLVLVKRKTRLEELIARFNTVEQARFYVEHLGSDFGDYQKEDTTYKQALRTVEDILSEMGRVQLVSREHVPNFMFGPQDIVIAVGQDGLVANTLKYLDGQPLIGVNPDPSRWDGMLLPFKAKDLRTLLPDVFANRRPISEVSMAKSTLNDGQIMYAVNDLFIGQKTHISARYHIQYAQEGEHQSSSGIIVSTGLGASGWLKSVVAGAAGIMGVEKISIPTGQRAWGVDYLQFSVREPFPSRTTGANIVFGHIRADKPMRITSYMPENGVIFSDGMESDFLEFRSGVVAEVAVAEKRGRLVL
ncbi:MAG: sugar kinase [Proteobacteria bacterium]|nr:NAD+ kinase [Cystobacterineae bacterium]MCL2258380.1 NAD+ kinase [Cystobacterineae bacterium]MCL2315108.1 sugar kinase [Pseudomonadota bacterium]